MKLRELRVDGYKNLARCVVPLRDFNVVVGPNNSGKSNLLEVFGVVGALCFGPEQDRAPILRGFPHRFPGAPPFYWFHPPRTPLSLGVTFEATMAQEAWVVDYDLKLSPVVSRSSKPGFESETLRAKRVGRTGPPTRLMKRVGETLVVGGRRRRLLRTISALSAIPLLYDRRTGPYGAITEFIGDMAAIARTRVLALSPDALRANLQTELMPEAHRTAALGILATMEQVFGRRRDWAEFRGAVLDILDLDDLHFAVHRFRGPRAGNGRDARSRRFRLCALRRGQGEFGDMSEYSDGTLVAISILATLTHVNPTRSLTCIEELENCLHPRAQQKLLEFLRQNSPRWQLLVTTHSPYLVNGVDPADILVAVVGENGLTRFEKPTNRKAIDDLLKSSYSSLGDLMVSNFKEVL